MEKKFVLNIFFIKALAFFLFLNYLISPILIQLVFTIFISKEWVGLLSNHVFLFRLISNLLVVSSLLFTFYLKRIGGFLLIFYLILEVGYSFYYVVSHQINLLSLKTVGLLVGGFIMTNLFLIILLYNIFRKEIRVVLDSKINELEFASVIKDSIFSNGLIKWTILLFLIVYFVSRILMYWGNLPT